MTCGHPFQNVTDLDDLMDIMIMEGATLTFECPPQYVLTGPGPYTMTCVGNGELEPDPGEV